MTERLYSLTAYGPPALPAWWAYVVASSPLAAQAAALPHVHRRVAGRAPL